MRIALLQMRAGIDPAANAADLVAGIAEAGAALFADIDRYGQVVRAARLPRQ